MQNLILHLDFDSFFASVEQEYKPALRGKPLGVTARNGSPNGACIIASSREAKRFGIKTGTRVFEAKKLCPSVALVKADFVKYAQVSKKFVKICDEFSPTVEIFSIDEVFMDVTLTAPLFGGVYLLVEKFKARLREELGAYITASVGISYNKLLAKLASGLKKPNGVMEISAENLAAVYQKAQLTDICGIGWRMQKRLNALGIYTLIHLKRTPLSSLVAEFGPAEASFLYNIATALDDRPVVPYADADEVKSVGRQHCLPHNEYDQRKILQHIYELCEEISIKLRRLGKKARTVGISLGGEPGVSGRHTSPRYLDSGKEIFEECLFVLESVVISSQLSVVGTQLIGYQLTGQPKTGKLLAENRKQKTDNSDSIIILGFVRQISISVSNLVDADTIPSPLLLQDQKWQKVTEAVDRINERFGDHTIRNAFLVDAPKLTTVPNGYSRG